MADLSEKDSTLPVKIIGSNQDGTEIDYIASSDGALHVSNFSGNSFSALALDIPLANNKSLLSVSNPVGSGVLLRIHSILLINSQNTVVTGVISEFRLLRCASHSGGTSIPISKFDSQDNLNAGIIVRTNATITSEDTTPLKRWKWSSDEWGTGTSDVESYDHALQNLIGAYSSQPGMKPLTLRPGEGLTLKHVTNSTVGTFDVQINFSQEG